MKKAKKAKKTKRISRRKACCGKPAKRNKKVKRVSAGIFQYFLDKLAAI